MVFSIIIPTYKDWHRLQFCLDAIQKQTFDKGKFEVIIVNNEEAHQVPDSFIIPPDLAVTLLHEQSSGSYAARNKGLNIAQGEILAFTDSDCIPDVNWLKNAFYHFENNELDRLAGHVELFYKNENSRNAVELYEAAFAFNQRRNVEKFRASITANFFARRVCFSAVGVFDHTKKSGEDFGWNRRANLHDLTLKYGEDVVVFHPARTSLKEISNKKKRVFGGKKVFVFNTPRGLLKEFVYSPFLFVTTFALPFYRLLFYRREFSFFQRVKIGCVQFYLYLVVQFEYFRLLFGGVPLR